MARLPGVEWAGAGRLGATRRGTVGCALAYALLSGCAEAPTYEPPVLWAPAGWRSPVLTVAPVRPEWWTAFNDPVLNSLMVRAAGNANVRMATARIPTDRAPRPDELWTRRSALAGARAAAAAAYIRVRSTAPHALNALTWQLGLPPGALDAELRGGTVPAAPVRVDAGPPAELARRRPDIRLAELALQAAGPDEARAAATVYQTAVLRALTEVDNAALSMQAAQQAEDTNGAALAFVAVCAALGTGWEVAGA